MKEGRLVITIPFWDTEAQHPFTVRAASELAYNMDHEDATVVFVDNASPYKASGQLVRGISEDKPQRIHLIENTENLGYSGGANQGLLWGYETGAEYFIVCNNDIYFLSPMWYKNLLAPLQRNPRSLCGIRYIPNNEWTKFDGEYHGYLEGAMLAFHRTFLEEVGYLDEIYAPAFVEDVDISWRAMEHGYEITEVQEVPIFHVYGATSYKNLNDWNALCEANMRKFEKKVRENKVEWVGPPEFRSDTQCE